MVPWVVLDVLHDDEVGAHRDTPRGALKNKSQSMAFERVAMGYTKRSTEN